MYQHAIAFDYHDQVLADNYDQLPLWSSHFGHLMLDHIPLQKGQTLLDVGCGTGFPLFELAGRLGESSHVVGLDIWQSALSRANGKRNYFGLPQVSLISYSGRDFPLADQAFDMVTSNLGVNNFADPHHAIRECYRVTRNGGALALTTNLVGHMAEFYNVFRQVLIDMGLTSAVDRLNHQEAHRGTVDSHCQLLQAGGYTIEQTVEHNFTIRYVDGTAFAQHWFIRLGFLPAWVNVIDEADRPTVFTALESRLNAYALEQGELRLTIPMVYILGRKS